MKTFIIKTITETSKEYDIIEASRMRTSNGFCKIQIEYGKQKISFTNENEDHDYEQKAIELARVLDKIALDPCDLPKQ